MLNPVSYRRLFTLANGKKVTCRLLNGHDQENLINLYQAAPPEDTMCLKQDFRDLAQIKNWVGRLTHCHTVLVALDTDKDQLIATAQMDRGLGCAQHVGEIQHIFVARPFRNLGLGSLLLGELVELAQAERLQWLKAEVVSEHKQAVRGFLSKGFQIKATLEDFFIARDGTTYDIALLTRPALKRHENDF